MKYRYNLINEKTNEKDHEEITCSEAAVVIGVTPNTMSSYVKRGKPVNGYIIETVLVDRDSVNFKGQSRTYTTTDDDGKVIVIDRELLAKARDIIDAATALRNGGRMRKTPKGKKYMEPKQ